MQSLAVSIIVPTWNRAPLLPRALDSALAQLEPDDEIIVVDDDSKDNTAEVVATYGARVKYFRIPNNGAGGARNFGIRKATRPLVAFLDSDDEWFPGKLALQRQVFAARPDVLFCFSNFAATDRFGRETRRYLYRWNRDERTWDMILGPSVPFSTLGSLPQGTPDFPVHVGDLSLAEMMSAYVLTSTVVARREEAGDALRFAEDVPTYEDLECFGRLALKGQAAYLDVETAWQHGHAGDRLTDIADLRAVTSNIIILERVWGSNPGFLKTYASQYHQTVKQLRIRKIVDLLSLGEASIARAELRLVKNPPLKLRLLTVLPGFLVSSLWRLKQSFATLLA